MKNKAMRTKFTYPQYIVGLYVGPRLNCTTRSNFPEGCVTVEWKMANRPAIQLLSLNWCCSVSSIY